MTRALALSLALAACAPADVSEGTAVGNLDATLKFATPVGDGVTGLAAAMAVESLSLLGCDGGVVTLATGIDLPLDGTGTLAVPTGDWCGARLTPAAPGRWTARSAEGFGLDVTLDLGAIGLRSTRPATFAAGDVILWAFGDRPWLDATALGADTADVVIAPGDDRHDELVAVVRRDQALVRDDDDDGRRGDDDDVLGRSEDDDDGPDDDSDDDERDDTDD